MKVKYAIISVLATVLLFAGADVQAFSMKADQSVYISAGETVVGNLYAAGQNLTVDGNVTGDVICAGQNIVINGNVTGDVICAGQGISINGEVGGNVRLVGSAINIFSKVARNAMIFGATAALGPKSEIGGDVMFGAAGLEARGKIAGEIHGGAAEATIDGEVGRDVNIAIDENSGNKNSQGKLTIGPNAKVGGAVYYHGDPGVNFVNNGTVSGEVKFIESKMAKPAVKDFAGLIAGALAIGFVVSFIGGLILILVLVKLFGERLFKVAEPMLKNVWPALGWGLVVVCVVPVVLMLAMFTVIGIRLALVAGLVWLLMIILGKCLAAVAFGELIWNKVVKKDKKSLYVVAALGFIVTYIIFIIPVLGDLAAMAAAFWGVGGICLWLKEMSAKK